LQLQSELAAAKDPASRPTPDRHGGEREGEARQAVPTNGPVFFPSEFHGPPPETGIYTHPPGHQQRNSWRNCFSGHDLRRDA